MQLICTAIDETSRCVSWAQLTSPNVDTTTWVQMFSYGSMLGMSSFAMGFGIGAIFKAVARI